MKKIFLILLVIFCSFVKISKVDASTLEREFIDNVWSFHYRGGKVHTYGQLNIKHIDGKIGYCIQPDANIYDYEYNPIDDWSVSGYDLDAKRKMEYYSYYGYAYPGHQTIRYYMATQELIWLLSPDESIKWTKENYSASEEIDISREKNEILRLVSLHRTIPSFYRSTIRTDVNTELTLTDTNGVLNGFNNDKYLSYDNDSIKINVKKQRINIRFTKKSLFDYPTYVYTSRDNKSQKVAFFGNPDLYVVDMLIIPSTAKIKINKKDLDTDELIKDSGNIVQIKNVTNDSNVGEYEFINGSIELSLEPGKYSVEEISSSNGYSINDKCMFFEVDLNGNDFSYDFYNEKLKGKIKIKKVDENQNSLEGVVFNIFDNDNNIVDTIVTTSNEYDESIPLLPGNYYVKEESTLYGYEVDNKIYNANIKIIDNSIIDKELEIVNEKIKCDFTFIGTDENDNDLNVLYEIYDLNDNLIYSGKEKNIKLEYGKYYLKQKEVSNGYKLNENVIQFEINDKSCITNIKLVNKKVNMPITSTAVDFISIIIFTLSFICYAFYKKID